MSADYFKQNRQKAFIFCLLIAASFLLLMMYFFKPEPQVKRSIQSGSVVTVKKLNRKSGPIVVTNHGFISANQRSTLAAEVSGKIVYIDDNFMVGEYAPKDHTLVKLDPRTYNFHVNSTLGQLKAAQAEERYLSKEYLRIKKLHDRGAASTHDLDKAEQLRDKAVAQVMISEADYNVAQLSAEKTNIKSTFKGQVIERRVSLGDYVKPGQALGEIYDINTLEVMLPLSLRQAKLIEDLRDFKKHRIKANIYSSESSDQQCWSGHITRVEPGIDKRTRTVDVVVKVDASFCQNQVKTDKRPHLGSYATVDIFGKHIDAYYLVPDDTVHHSYQSDGDTVWLVKQGKLHIVPVNIIEYRDHHVAITSPEINNQDLLITSSLSIFSEGMNLKIRTPDVVAKHE